MATPKKKHDLVDGAEIKKGYDGSPDEVHITSSSIAFAVWNQNDGMGKVIVTLKPGQQETLTVNGHLVTVIRDYVQ